MATPSGWEKELKQQEGEVPAGLKNEVAHVPGDAGKAGNLDPGAWVPTVCSYPSLLGGGATRFGREGDSTCALAAPGAILNIAEDPGSPSKDCEQIRGRPEHRGSQSPLAELRRVGRETGQSLPTVPTESTGVTGQATSGAAQLYRRPAQTRSPAKGHGPKRPSGVEAAGSPKHSWRCLFRGAPAPEASATLPPSSPTAQPSSHGRRPTHRVSPCDRASQPGPALRSQALLSAPGPALCSQAPRQAVPPAAAKPRQAVQPAAAKPRQALRPAAVFPRQLLLSAAVPLRRVLLPGVVQLGQALPSAARPPR
ncbi:EZH inhibitory protein-like isoform 1-T3 [Hipposideros larvatus]